MKIKVPYDSITTLAKSGYPENIAYQSIPEPYIEVSEEVFQANLGKQMCVVDGVYKEHIVPEDEIIEQLKNHKKQELKTNRDSLLNNSQVFTILVNDEECSFSLSNKDLPVVQSRIARLTNDVLTLGWTSVQGNRIELNRIAFKRLQSHIDANDEATYSLYSEKLAQLNELTEKEKVENFNTNLI